MGLTLVTPASVPLASTDDALWECRVDPTAPEAEQQRVARYVASATAMVEEFLGRSVAEQEWALSLDKFGDVIELPRGPVNEVGEITYLDIDGDEQELDASVFALDLVSDPPRVVRAANASWPAVANVPNAVTITFTAGFAAGHPALDMARHVVLASVARWYNNPGEMCLSKDAKDALRPWRRIVI